MKNRPRTQEAISFVDERNVQAMQFGLLSPDTVADMSVAEINSSNIYDHETFQPNFHAVNDPRLGVLDKESTCVTCKSGMEQCAGHFGHIALNAPVYHGGLLVFVTKILKCVCFSCQKLLAPRNANKNLADQEKESLLKIKNPKARFRKLLSLAEEVRICDIETGGCGYIQPKFKKGSLKIEVEYRDENFDKTQDRKQLLWPDQAMKVLEKITDADCRLIGLDSKFGRPEWCVIKNLAVAPPAVRPSVTMSSCHRSEDDLTYAYQQIIKINNLLREQTQNGANQTIINELRTSLQYFVATLMDNGISGQPVQKHKSGKPLKSIRSRLKGKEGRLRYNLMGKRVDFSSRTVITPDPNLALDQIGVPYKVATGLTVPESVTLQNMSKLQQLVMNGPCQWPGAKFITRNDGKQIDLAHLRNRSDVHLEIGYIVERHLQDGDYVMVNRQPSLHKCSIMGHRVKVLPFQTFRLNLSVTTPYNADFDGDEMNIHVPQSYESLAEVKEIMSVPHQILSPQSNKPVMGIVQDSLLGSMLMTLQDSFVDREEAMQLFMWISDQLPGEAVRTLPVPAIMKPKPLWTGKQIFSLVVPKINLSRKKNDNPCCPKDSNVLIVRGELICGSVNKSVIGSNAGSLSHLISREYGPTTCAEFLASVQCMVNQWLIFNGFTVGVSDIIVTDKKIETGISQILKKFKRSVDHIIAESESGRLKSQPGKTMQESFEASVNKQLNEARDRSGNMALDGLLNSNRLRNMVTAGSKGSNINISQIMACVGQQNVEGKRIPLGFNRRSLPHFNKDDVRPESRGFVESCYLKGLNPQEFYFHAMGGREGLIDTAVKTAETGYISRRLIKALEDVMVKYDGTVRNSHDGIVQFIYGEDGMAGEGIEDLAIDTILKTTDKQLKNHCRFPARGQSDRKDQLLQQAVTEPIFASLASDLSQMQSLDTEFRTILSDRKFLRSEVYRSLSRFDDQVHLPVNLPRILWNTKTQFNIKPTSKSDLHPKFVVSKLEELLNTIQVVPGSRQAGNSMLGEADLNAKMLFNTYVRHQLCAKKVIIDERLSHSAFEWLLSEIKSRFELSLVRPGEMVGSIAAQSLGEPATQMTLNTFHFAGISAKNVTLGVPRFKEIINVSNNIKTPGLKIFMTPKHQKQESKASKLGMLIEYATLAHVVARSSIHYDPNPERTLIADDAALVQLYNEVPSLEERTQKLSPWVLRFELDHDKLVAKGLSMALIDKKLTETFSDQINLMVSDENSDKHVVRVRLNNIEDDEEQTVPSYLRNEFEPLVLHELALKGFPEIAKVTFSKHQSQEFDPVTGKLQVGEDNWLVETDGTALAKILAVKKVDATRTISNDNIEVLNVLGCEAARQSLINEIRFVLSSYGIYVNYRHLATLVDVMTLRGKLTSITRHGINRVDNSGPLRKCSFEETVEILLESAFFSEKDHLTGITENIIVGQLGPFGTGSFGIRLDQEIVENHAKNVTGLFCDAMDLAGGDTPMQCGDLGTPFIGLTPALGGMTSAYTPNTGNMMTPGPSMTPVAHFGAFTPRPDFGFGLDSPHYQSPSPAYGVSPNYGGVVNPISPIYQNGLASPIYFAGRPSVGSPAYNVSSPVYIKRDPYSPAYAAVQNSNGSGDKSLGPLSRDGINYLVSPVSPSYSPSGLVQSPIYSSNPILSGMGSASPSSLSKMQNMPSYSPPGSIYSGQVGPSPCYIPSATAAPLYESSNQEMSANHLKEITSPAYNPKSPEYKRVKEELP